MGICDDTKAGSTSEKSTIYVNADNEIVAEFAQGTIGGLTSKLEILRGDQVRILYEKTKHNVKYIFDDYEKDQLGAK